MRWNRNIRDGKAEERTGERQEARREARRETRRETDGRSEKEREARATGGKWTKSAGRLRWNRNIQDKRDCRGARGLLLEGETRTWNREDLCNVEHEAMQRGA